MAVNNEGPNYTVTTTSALLFKTKPGKEYFIVNIGSYPVYIGINRDPVVTTVGKPFYMLKAGFNGRKWLSSGDKEEEVHAIAKDATSYLLVDERDIGRASVETEEG